MSICRPHEHRTVMIVLTVTPIDRLHKSDGPNGVKGAAEEDKIWDKAWRAQQAHVHGPKEGRAQRAHVHGPKEGRAHSLCGAPDKTKAQTCPPRFRFPKTCSARKGLGLQGQDLPYKEKTCPTRIRLALQGKDLGYKERRQDLTTIKAPTSSSQKGTRDWLLSSTLEL